MIGLCSRNRCKLPIGSAVCSAASRSKKGRSSTALVWYISRASGLGDNVRGRTAATSQWRRNSGLDPPAISHGGALERRPGQVNSVLIQRDHNNKSVHCPFPT